MENSLFNELGVSEDWKEHWQDMPEFIQDDQEPMKQVIVNFEKPEDIKAFAELIGQNITLKTKSIWYPQATIDNAIKKVWLNENKVKDAP